MADPATQVLEQGTQILDELKAAVLQLPKEQLVSPSLSDGEYQELFQRAGDVSVEDIDRMLQDYLAQRQELVRQAAEAKIAKLKEGIAA